MPAGVVLVAVRPVRWSQVAPEQVFRKVARRSDPVVEHSFDSILDIERLFGEHWMTNTRSTRICGALGPADPGRSPCHTHQEASQPWQQ